MQFCFLKTTYTHHFGQNSHSKYISTLVTFFYNCIKILFVFCYLNGIRIDISRVTSDGQDEWWQEVTHGDTVIPHSPESTRLRWLKLKTHTKVVCQCHGCQSTPTGSHHELITNTVNIFRDLVSAMIHVKKSFHKLKLHMQHKFLFLIRPWFPTFLTKFFSLFVVKSPSYWSFVERTLWKKHDSGVRKSGFKIVCFTLNVINTFYPKTQSLKS